MDTPEFTRTKWREGYDFGEVDRFVERALMSMTVAHAQPMSPAEVENVRFTPVRLRAGYDMGEVDAFLDLLAVRLAALPPRQA